MPGQPKDKERESSVPELALPHLERVRAFYDAAPPDGNWASRGYCRLLAHYYRLLVPAEASVLEIGCGSGQLLARIPARRRVGVDLSPVRIAAARAALPGLEFHVRAGESLALGERFDCIILSDTLNQAADAQRLLDLLHGASHPGTRLILNFPSALWRPLLTLARWLGLKAAQPQSNWLSTTDVVNLLHLTGWSPVRVEAHLLVPVPLLGVDRLVNRWIAPVFAPLCLTVFAVARPEPGPGRPPRSVSVVIPARNEAGNIEAAVRRTPEIGAGTEIVFVEGHSDDNTWGEMLRVAEACPNRRIQCIRQPGHGKYDAVQAGFAAAMGDILMVLDADLTVPPEELPKFYEAIASGRAEFVNGVRLVYPMDDEAMPFLNLCANKAFSLIFSWLIGQPVKDTLCGTKVLSKEHYRKIAENRSHFGDFDPFGDFDLLFGAARLNLKILDLPIRYRERTYGQTKIHRWGHGWLLLRMVLLAARKLKFV
jgi:SAM-dependent methyltransferase